MITINRISVVLVTIFVLTGLSCQSSEKTEKQTNYLEENQELRDRLDDQARANQAANDELRMIREELRKEQEARMELAEELESQKKRVPVSVPANKESVNSALENIDGVEVTMDSSGTRIVVSSDVLFSSGSATLTSSAKSTLAKISNQIKGSYSNRMIELVGHTDTKMMKPATRKKFKDNMGLGYERAKSVRDYLQQSGISPRLMKVSSRGSLEPKSTDAASRRVEIVVLN